MLLTMPQSDFFICLRNIDFFLLDRITISILTKCRIVPLIFEGKEWVKLAKAAVGYSSLS